MLDAFSLVLVGPMYAGNVGACARVAANFDVRDLRIVAPQCDLRDPEALLYAKGPARAYLGRVQVYASVAEAVAGCELAVGFTRRTGKRRQALEGLSALSGLVEPYFTGAPGPAPAVALVFGREDGGLTQAELRHCSHLCSFAVAPTMPSVNLSHATAMVLSRLFEDARLAAGKSRQAQADGATARIAELDEVLEHWRQALIDARLTTGGNPERMLEVLRKLLQRARLTSREAGVLRAYLSKTQVAMGTRRRLRG